MHACYLNNCIIREYLLKFIHTSTVLEIFEKYHNPSTSTANAIASKTIILNVRFIIITSPVEIYFSVVMR